MSSQLCLDLSVPLYVRLESLRRLDSSEIDNLLEVFCSAYNIHPTHLVAEYLHYLILEDISCIRRRIRIAEACDLGRTVLYLLTRIHDTQDRIGIIELFENPALKLHAYAVLFTRADADLCVQIMKNCFRLATKDAYRACYASWFVERLRDTGLTYALRANCADFLWTHFKNKEAKQFLRMDRVLTEENLFEHAENVHCFVPRISVLERILGRVERTPIEDILEFVRTSHHSMRVFRQRILNDKTRLGSLKIQCTLEELVCAVWPHLTDELRDLLLHDMDSSIDPESGWMCTTGYYNRILNIYQAASDETLFEWMHAREHFQECFFKKLNQALVETEKTDDIMTELTETTEAKRIQYLTFRIHSLPRVIDELRAEFSDVPYDQFDEWINQALSEYER